MCVRSCVTMTTVEPCSSTQIAKITIDLMPDSLSSSPVSSSASTRIALQQRPGDRDALLFAARQLAGTMFEPVSQPDTLQQFNRLASRAGVTPCGK